jgi:hypothetical protein
MKRTLPTLLLTLALATPAVAAADTGGKTGTREVCAKSSYVKRSPGFVVIGTLFKDQKIKVTRYDKSGKHAYGYARGNVRKHGWVLTRDLCK